MTEVSVGTFSVVIIERSVHEGVGRNRLLVDTGNIYEVVPTPGRCYFPLCVLQYVVSVPHGHIPISRIVGPSCVQTFRSGVIIDILSLFREIWGFFHLVLRVFLHF